MNCVCAGYIREVTVKLAMRQNEVHTLYENSSTDHADTDNPPKCFPS